jgi:acyl-CoA thioesterase-1
MLAMILAMGTTVAAGASEKRVVALGDSLTAGFQLPANAAFPNVLERALRERGHQVKVANAGVSGDTTAAALERLDWALGEGADAAIVALGANDMLRGVDPERTQAALDEIITRLKAKNVQVLLAGMLATPSLGAEYGARFNAIYPRLAEKHDVLLYPFFLDGVAQVPKLNLADGIHPNREGVQTIVKRILPDVERLIARVESAQR